jgi:hypothetical protein
VSPLKRQGARPAKNLILKQRPLGRVSKNERAFSLMVRDAASRAPWLNSNNEQQPSVVDPRLFRASN